MALAGSLLLLVSLAVMGATQDGPSAPEPRFVRLKPAEEELRRLMVDGYRRSATFRALADEIHRTNGLVVVQYGQCGKGRFRSCVSNVAGDQRQRAIRIKIDAHATPDRLTATIAHELAHATEILSDPTVTSPEATLEMYRKIGTVPCRRRITDECETQHALDIEMKVLAELNRARPGGEGR